MEQQEIKICRATLTVLKNSLIWPNQSEELNPGKWFLLRLGLFLTITGLWAISVLMHLIMKIKNNTDTPVTADIAFLFAFSGLYYMTLHHAKNQPKIASLLQDLSRFQFGEPPGFKQLNKKLNLWSYILCFYAVFGIITYNVVEILKKPECDKKNQEKNLNEICGLFSAVWLPFKANFFPVYQLVFLYVFISAQIFLKLALIISFNLLEIVNNIILRIDHLNVMITECFDDENYEISKVKLQKCIMYHLEILNLSSRLADCFSDAMFGHFTITAAICGCLEKQYVDGENQIGSILHVFGWIMALFVACLGGQHLINASETIPEAIWSSKWYKTDVRLRKDLLFMLVRSQQGLRIKAGSFSTMSFPIFVSVMKMSYSILAMLKS